MAQPILYEWYGARVVAPLWRLLSCGVRGKVLTHRIPRPIFLRVLTGKGACVPYSPAHSLDARGGGGLVVAEDAGLDDDADAEHGVELFVVEQAFAVAVVVLEEEVLVVALEEAIVELDDGVVVE